MKKTPIILFVLLTLLSAKPKTKVWDSSISRETNAITQTKQFAIATVYSNEESIPILAVGCWEGTVDMRIVADYAVHNGIDSMFNKSELQKSLEQKVPDNQKYGFTLFAQDGKWRSHIKMRLDPGTDVIDSDVPAAWIKSKYVLLLGEFLPTMLPKMTDGAKLIVELPLKHDLKKRIRTFEFNGFREALARVQAAGCRV